MILAFLLAELMYYCQLILVPIGLKSRSGLETVAFNSCTQISIILFLTLQMLLLLILQMMGAFLERLMRMQLRQTLRVEIRVTM